MKIFTKKGITQKIILLIIIAILWNFVFPTFSRADVGGLLFDPIANLVMTIGDVVVSALQVFFYDGNIDVIGDAIFKDYTKIPEMTYTGSDTNKPVEIDASRLGNLWDIIGAVVTGRMYSIPTIQYSVDKIFAGKVPAFDINFINPNMYKEHGAGTDVHLAYQFNVNNTISKWYVSLRNLAIVILLSVLVYTGIRIVISSSADDKAKYKQRIFDWVVAMCLIFFMHYIMLFTMTIVDTLNGTIGDAVTSIPVKISDGTQFNTSLTGLVRLQAQYSDFSSKVTFMIFYIALVVYTVKFSWIYLKRLVTMMFLTIIAPLVAMTYPIDKMNDGKAQAFNAWLKEYIFTALLQPFHLIVYTVLVGSAIDVVKTNPLFAIMVIAFIGPAEKLLRKFFGFDKASTPGTLSQAGAMFGGAAAWNMLKKGAGLIANKGSGGKSGSGGNNNVRTKGGNAVEDQNAPGGYDAFANSNNRNSGATGDGTSNNSNTQDTDDDYSNRAFLPEDNNTQTQDPNNWDNNDMYLNPQNYSSDFANGTSGSNTTDDMHRQAEATADIMAETNNNRSFLQKAGAVAVAPAKGAWRSLKNTYSRKFANGRWRGTGLNALKKTAKFAGRVAVAGTVGAIGVGMGIAGDDLEDVLKYGAAGGALGYSVAPGVGRRIANSNLAQSIKEETGKAMHGSVNAAEIVAQTNELYQSGELRDWAQETFLDENGNKRDGKELNELEDRAIGHYNDGFTDKGDIKKVMKLEDKMRKELQQSLPAEEAKEQARVMSESIGKIIKEEEIEPKKLSNSNYVNEKLGMFEKRIHKENPNLSNNEAKATATQIMNYIMQYYKKS